MKEWQGQHKLHLLDYTCKFGAATSSVSNDLCALFAYMCAPTDTYIDMSDCAFAVLCCTEASNASELEEVVYLSLTDIKQQKLFSKHFLFLLILK
jgi:hypothetical protein